MGVLQASIILFFVINVNTSEAWHIKLELAEEKYYCWPRGASENNLMPYPTCPGIDFKWLRRPPDIITVAPGQTPWHVAFKVSLHQEFFTWATEDFEDGFKKNLFMGVSQNSKILDGPSAKDWCEATPCKNSTGNCCFSLVQLHSCFAPDDDLCLPWQHPDDTLARRVTHFSTSASGTTGSWTVNMTDAYSQMGTVNLVAYLELPGMSVAMKRKIAVQSNGLQLWHIASISSICILVALILISVLGWKFYEMKRALLDESWIILKRDLFPERSSVINLSMKDGTPIICKEDEHVIDFDSLQCQVTQFNGPVVLKRYGGGDMKLTKKNRREVMEVRSLSHANICKFIGACSSPPYLYIVMTYCRRGSLSDVLLEPENQLSWKFRLQFAFDVICGLRYLNKENMHHGNLKSTNCLVDKFWTVKLTDFGLESLRDNMGLTEQKRKDAIDRIYRPRECGPDVFLTGSVEYVDVYAYGIILIELVNRKPPYLEFDPESLEPNWKPPIPMFNQSGTDDVCPCEEEYTELMLYCLSDIPKYRPSIRKTKCRMKRLQIEDKDVSGKLSLLEAYSSLLESHVKEEKQKLETEKQRVVDMYHVMIPKTLSTESTAAEGKCFKDCTVYFSDILGFTALVAESSPKEVVSLLNQVYNRFHRVVAKYEVCVVEVIGDGYLMVSGAPHPNPQHAKVLANMSLDLLKHCEYFPILHHQEKKPVIRIGLHSGSVYGGIVHQAIPTFHIFGDTVTMASRIAATSKAQKIHIGETTFKHLEGSGEYNLRRNTLSVKGTRSWWLLGKLKHHTTSKAVPEPLQSRAAGRYVRGGSVRESGDCSPTENSESSETLSERSAREIAVTFTMEGGQSPV